MTLELTPDELLSTTRAVRKRLDLDRPVPDALVRECVAAALQAPSGSNNITMRFVVVTDPDKRRAMGELYASCWAAYQQTPQFLTATKRDDATEQAQTERVYDSATFLAENMGRVPTLVLACHDGARADKLPSMLSVGLLGNVAPAMWSFMLAARARGLGTAWTTIHLMKEKEMADILGIPFDRVQQVCLSPLAYTKGTDFKPAKRPEPDTVIRWNGW
jgi:nitroreductase